MSFNTPSISTSKEKTLSHEEQETYDKDLNELKNAGLESRLSFGLDPAAMMTLSDTAKLTTRIAEQLGTSTEQVKPLIDELHKKGPWELADRLAQAQEPEIKTYFVLASACHEKDGRDPYTPTEYLKDRTRVIQKLATFSLDNLEQHKQNIMSEVKNRTDTIYEKDGARTIIPIAEGDPALALAMQGFKGCVTRGGDMRFAQTSHIDDSTLEQANLVKGFAEVFDPQQNGFKRVALNEAPEGARIVWIHKEDGGKELQDMKPAAKRIGSGYVLTYTDENLAVELVANSIAHE